MKKALKIILIIAGSAVLALTAGILALLLKYGPNFGLYLIPPTPVKYVRDAMAFAENGIYASGDAWQEAKTAAIEKAAGCRTYEETYPIIQEALNVAGGKHSKIRSKDQTDEAAGKQMLPECSFENGILYIRLPEYNLESGQGSAYAETVLSAVRENRDGIEGVILDLRDNTGGDMGPMVAAVSPFLPDGTVLRFEISGQTRDVILSEGTVTGGGSATEVEDPGKLTVPVAVLQNEMTASSGEAVLLCFKGLDNVRFFGCGTAGYCSTNTVRKMYDGATIQLTVGCDVDRTGQKYCEDPIAPDVETRDPLKDAEQWIEEAIRTN